jgi:hypothetical protein
MIWAACAALGCDPAYVSPDTVALLITDTASSAQRVNRCHYVPVLLGSRDRARYTVDERLRVTIDLTRDQVSLSFDDDSGPVDPFEVESSRFKDGGVVAVPSPPSGYKVELASPCTPDD